MNVWVVFVGFIVHGHGDIQFAHYALDLYLADSNHIIESFVKLLRNLKKPPPHSSRLLFENVGSTPLYELLLEGKDVWLNSLSESHSVHVIAKNCPPLCMSKWTPMQRIVRTNMC